MVVKTQYEGFRISGLYVGVNNVRRYFSKRNPVVELQLDHLQIQCGLTAGFWKDRPEIHDHRLCEWLESKHFHEKPCSTPVLLALIPFGKNSFKVTSLGADWKVRKEKAISKPVARTGSSATDMGLDEEKVALVGVA
jgi:hypothetical protein